MYKNDINSLKEALIVIMPTLEATSPTEEESYESKMVEQAPSHDSHFCKNTHRLVRRFKQHYGIEPVDGVVDREIWDRIMKSAKHIFL